MRDAERFSAAELARFDSAIRAVDSADLRDRKSTAVVTFTALEAVRGTNVAGTSAASVRLDVTAEKRAGGWVLVARRHGTAVLVTELPA